MYHTDGKGGWHQLADMFHSACRRVFEACAGVLAMHQSAPLQNLSEMSLESVTFQTTTSTLTHNTLKARNSQFGYIFSPIGATETVSVIEH